MSSITASSIPRFSLSNSSSNTAPNQFGFASSGNCESPSHRRLSSVSGTTQNTQLPSPSALPSPSLQLSPLSLPSLSQQQQQLSKLQQMQSQQQNKPEVNSRLPINDIKRKCHINYSSATITKSRSQSKLIVHRNTDRAALNPELFTQISRSTFELQTDNKQNTDKSLSQLHSSHILLRENTNLNQVLKIQRPIFTIKDLETSSVDRLHHRKDLINVEESFQVMESNKYSQKNVIGSVISNDNTQTTDQLTTEPVSYYEDITNSHETTSNGHSYANQAINKSKTKNDYDDDDGDVLVETRRKLRLSDIMESPCLIRYGTKKCPNNNPPTKAAPISDDEENDNGNKALSTQNCNNNEQTTMTSVLSSLSFISLKNEHENAILTISNGNDIGSDCLPDVISTSSQPLIVSNNNDTDRYNALHEQKSGQQTLVDVNNEPRQTLILTSQNISNNNQVSKLRPTSNQLQQKTVTNLNNVKKKPNNVTSKQTSMSIQHRSNKTSSDLNKTGNRSLIATNITKLTPRINTGNFSKNRTGNQTNSGASTPASESDCLSLISNISNTSTNNARARKTISNPQLTKARNASVISTSKRISNFTNPSSTGTNFSRMRNSETYVKLPTNPNGSTLLTNDITKTGTIIKTTITNTSNCVNKRPTIGSNASIIKNNKESSIKNATLSTNMTSVFKVPGTTKSSASATKTFNSVISSLNNTVNRTANTTRPSSVASNASSSTNPTSLASTKSISKTTKPLTKTSLINGTIAPSERRSNLKNVPTPKSTPVSMKQLQERLKTNAEAHRIEVEQLKKQLDILTKNFDASVVIIKYLDSEYSPFETPNLRSELAKTQEQCRSLKQEFELSKELSNQQIMDLERDLRTKEEMISIKASETEDKLSHERGAREAAETKLIALENASKSPNKKFLELKERITNYQKEVESLNVVVELKISKIKELDSEKMKLQCDLSNYDILKESYKNVQRENESFKETLALKARKNAELLRELDNVKSELRRERQNFKDESVRCDQYKYQLDETREQLAKLTPERSSIDAIPVTPFVVGTILSNMTSTPAVRIAKPKSSKCLFGEIESVKEEKIEEL